GLLEGRVRQNVPVPEGVAQEHPRADAERHVVRVVSPTIPTSHNPPCVHRGGPRRARPAQPTRVTMGSNEGARARARYASSMRPLCFTLALLAALSATADVSAQPVNAETL